MKGYLSPTISGNSLTEIIEWSDAVRSQHTEVEVVLQETCTIIKAEKPDEVSGKFCRNNNNFLQMTQQSE